MYPYGTKTAQRYPLHVLVGHLLIYPGGASNEAYQWRTPRCVSSPCWSTLRKLSVQLLTHASRWILCHSSPGGPVRRIGWDTARANPVLVGHSWRIGWDAYGASHLSELNERDPIGLQHLAPTCPAPLTICTFGSVEGGQKIGKALEPKWPRVSCVHAATSFKCHASAHPATLMIVHCSLMVTPRCSVPA